MYFYLERDQIIIKCILLLLITPHPKRNYRRRIGRNSKMEIGHYQNH